MPTSAHASRPSGLASVAALACVLAALTFTACGDDNSDELKTLKTENAALTAQNAKQKTEIETLTAENGKLEAGRTELKDEKATQAQDNALLELENANKGERVAELKARGDKAKKAAARAEEAATELGKTAADLGTRNQELRASTRKLQAQLAEYQAAAKVVQADYEKASAAATALVRCTDFVRKAYNGSRSPGAAKSVCRDAAERYEALFAG